jgi:hypothetical protein
VPRIRAKRDYDWEPNNEDFPEALSTPTGDQQDDAVDRAAHGPEHECLYEGYEADSGASWLSNAVVIGSLPDNKLRAALARYQAIVRLCEAELAARACAPRRRNRQDSRYIDLDVAEVHQRRARGARPRKTSAAAKSLLTPKQMLKALEMLMKLKEKQT